MTYDIPKQKNIIIVFGFQINPTMDWIVTFEYEKPHMSDENHISIRNLKTLGILDISHICCSISKVEVSLTHDTLTSLSTSTLT